MDFISPKLIKINKNEQRDKNQIKTAPYKQNILRDIKTHNDYIMPKVGMTKENLNSSRLSKLSEISLSDSNKSATINSNYKY